VPAFRRCEFTQAVKVCNRKTPLSGTFRKQGITPPSGTFRKQQNTDADVKMMHKQSFSKRNNKVKEQRSGGSYSYVYL
jgi:hypothetical protein